MPLLAAVANHNPHDERHLVENVSGSGSAPFVIPIENEETHASKAMNLTDEIIERAKAEGWQQFQSFKRGWYRICPQSGHRQEWHPEHGYNFGSGPFPQPEPLTAEKARAQVREHLAEAKEEMRKQPITQPAADVYVRADNNVHVRIGRLMLSIISHDYGTLIAVLSDEQKQTVAKALLGGTHVAVPRELAGEMLKDLNSFLGFLEWMKERFAATEGAVAKVEDHIAALEALLKEGEG